MKKFCIRAMNVESGHKKIHFVMGESMDHAVQRLESDEYITDDAPYGWEVVEYEFYDYDEV